MNRNEKCYWPYTDHLQIFTDHITFPTDHIPTGSTDHITNHILTAFIDHILTTFTNHMPTTNWPHANHVPTSFTDQINLLTITISFFMFHLIVYRRKAKRTSWSPVPCPMSITCLIWGTSLVAFWVLMSLPGKKKACPFWVTWWQQISQLS